MLSFRMQPIPFQRFRQERIFLPVVPTAVFPERVSPRTHRRRSSKGLYVGCWFTVIWSYCYMAIWLNCSIVYGSVQSSVFKVQRYPGNQWFTTKLTQFLEQSLVYTFTHLHLHPSSPNKSSNSSACSWNVGAHAPQLFLSKPGDLLVGVPFQVERLYAPPLFLRQLFHATLILFSLPLLSLMDFGIV